MYNSVVHSIAHTIVRKNILCLVNSRLVMHGRSQKLCQWGQKTPGKVMLCSGHTGTRHMLRVVDPMLYIFFFVRVGVQEPNREHHIGHFWEVQILKVT